MTFKETISHLRKSPMDAWYYIQGETRLYCFRRKNLKWLIRKHIGEQYTWRMKHAAFSCLMNGSCLCCECETPALFFAKKECSAGKIQRCVDRGLKKCYPELMSKQKWASYKFVKGIQL